jgi:hypothetical protein
MLTVRTSLLLVILALAAPAQAAQLYVDDNGAGPPTPGCTSQSFPCSTIAAALTASRANATTDTINLAAGTYAEDVVLDQPEDSSLTIDGAGAGLFNSSTIQVANSATWAVQVGAGSMPYNTGITLRDLRVVVPAGSGSSKGGIIDYALNATFENMLVSVAEPSSLGIGLGIFADSGTTTVNSVSGLHQGNVAVAGNIGNGAVNVTGSIFQHLSSSFAGIGYVASGGLVRMSNSLVRLPAGSTAAGISVAGTTSMTIDSSLVQGGGIGVQVRETSAKSGLAIVRRSTIDIATAGSNDGGPGFASVYATTSGNADAQSTIDVRESILVDTPAAAQAAVGTPTVTCTRSITPLVAVENTTCDATGGNAFFNPAALFVDAPARDYRLLDSSPAIDFGSPSLEGGEPSVDYADDPRLVEGDLDCVLRADAGAFEYQATGTNTAPSGTATGPGSGVAGQVLDFSASATDPEELSTGIVYSWAFSDGGSATGAAVQHVFATAGSYTATLTTSDSLGCTDTDVLDVQVTAPPAGGGGGGGGGSTTPAADTTAPAIAGAKVRRRTLRFTVSEAAQVTIRLARRACARVKGKKRCRYRAAGRRVLAATAGETAVTLPKRKGRWRALITATDAAGNTSVPAKVGWRRR